MFWSPSLMSESEVKLLSRFWPFATPWTVAHQAPPSMGFSRQEYWRGLPLPSPGNLPDPGIEPRSPTLQADALTSEPPGKPQSESESHSVVSDSLWPHGPHHGILQARTLEWVAFLFFIGSSQPRDQSQLSRIAGRLFISWTTRAALADESGSQISLCIKTTWGDLVSFLISDLVSLGLRGTQMNIYSGSPVGDPCMEQSQPGWPSPGLHKKIVQDLFKNISMPRPSPRLIKSECQEMGPLNWSVGI